MKGNFRNRIFMVLINRKMQNKKYNNESLYSK